MFKKLLLISLIFLGFERPARPIPTPVKNAAAGLVLAGSTFVLLRDVVKYIKTGKIRKETAIRMLASLTAMGLSSWYLYSAWQQVQQATAQQATEERKRQKQKRQQREQELQKKQKEEEQELQKKQKEEEQEQQKKQEQEQEQEQEQQKKLEQERLLAEKQKEKEQQERLARGQKEKQERRERKKTGKENLKKAIIKHWKRNPLAQLISKEWKDCPPTGIPQLLSEFTGEQTKIDEILEQHQEDINKEIMSHILSLLDDHNTEHSVKDNIEQNFNLNNKHWISLVESCIGQVKVSEIRGQVVGKYIDQAVDSYLKQTLSPALECDLCRDIHAPNIAIDDNYISQLSKNPPEKSYVGVDFSHQDLRYVDFSWQVFIDCNFSYAQLDGAYFYNAIIINTKMCGIRTDSQSEIGGYLYKVDFTGSNLEHLTPSNIRFSRKVTFGNSTLNDALLVQILSHQQEFSNLENLDLRETDLCELIKEARIFTTEPNWTILKGAIVTQQQLQDIEQLKKQFEDKYEIPEEVIRSLQVRD
ncbi:pentapeptide repeat-containing protein [Candidatus Dependentiae bacterium]